MKRQPTISDSRMIETHVYFTNAGRSAQSLIEYRDFPCGQWQKLPMKPEPRWKAQERARAAFPNALHN